MAYEQNSSTLIAAFNNYSAARQAERDLEANGIPSDSIQIESNRKTAGAASGNYEAEQEHEKSGFAHWWHSHFGSDKNEVDRRDYEGALERGSAILRASVPAQSVDTAVDILNRNGAVDVDRPSDDESNRPVQVVEEKLQVGKRAVRRGGVRIYSHVVDQPVEQQVKLREEHVKVERRKVDRDLDPDEISSLRDQTIEVAEMKEEPVIAKRARVREEVVVGKETTERTETVRDNVRHTEVKVEHLGGEQPAAEQPSHERLSYDRSPLNTPAPSIQAGSGTTAGAGTLAGKATAGSAIQDFPKPEFDPEYRRHFEQNYGGAVDFESMRPAYEYGSLSGRDPQYRDRSWDQVENDLRSDYERRNPGSEWEKAKDAVRYGWEKVSSHR